MGCGSSSSKKGRDFTDPVRVPRSESSGMKDGLGRTRTLKAVSGKMMQKSVFEDYTVGRSLGTGGFGTVHQARHKISGAQRALKIITKESIENWQIDECFMLAEVRVLSELTHPGIVNIYDMYQDDKRFYVTMELCQGGELYSELAKRGNLTEIQAAKVMFELFSAVSYWHARKVIHRDLKPQNILLMERGASDFTIKITDFGCSWFFDVNQKTTGIMGTMHYIAPEVLKNCYNEKWDIWSIGVIMFIMLGGCPPFDGQTDDHVKEQIRKCKLVDINVPQLQHISDNARDLLSRLLTVNLKQRISAMDALQHPWIIDYTSANPPPSAIMNGALSNLKNFNSSSKLKEAVQNFISQRLVQAKDLKELNEVFLAIDQNGDGHISKEELMTYYLKTMSAAQAESEVDAIMSKVDTDESGQIDYQEFLTASMDENQLLTKQNLQNTFKVFDKDNSGTITMQELQIMLGFKGEEHDPVWDEIIKEADANGDGEIDLKEFEALLIAKA